MHKRIFTYVIEYIKKHKVYLIPLGTLFVIAAVLGGLLIDSIYLAMPATVMGLALGSLIFWGNKKLFQHLSASPKEKKQKNLIYLGLYLLILLLLCSGMLFLIGIYRFDMLILTGLTLVFQLFSLSLIEAVHSIKNS